MHNKHLYIHVDVALSHRKLSMSVPIPLPNYKSPEAREPQPLHIQPRKQCPGRAHCRVIWFLLSIELLPRPTAQRLQVEMDTILGAQDQLRHLDGQPRGIQRELKAEQREGRDHFYLIHGKLLSNAVPTVSSTKRRCTLGCWDW